MEKKDQGKKMDPKTFWSQVAKSGQMKATSSLTSGSSFTGAAAGGAWTSTRTGGGGAWASSERPVPPAWPSRTPYKSVSQKSGSESRGKAHLPLELGAGEHGHLLGLQVEEHGHHLGLRAEEHAHLLSIPCCLLGHHGPRTSPCHKNRGQSRGKAHLPLELGAGEHGHLLKLGAGEHGHLLGLWAEEHGHLLGLRVEEHGHLLGLRVEEHGHLLSDPCRLLGHHGLRTNPYHKDRSRSHGSLPKPMSSPFIACRLNCLHERHQNLNRHPMATWNLHRCQKCVK